MLVQVMGLCLSLAVRGTVLNGISMALATAFTLIGSAVFASALRRYVPHVAGLSTYVLIVATFVTITDLQRVGA